MVFIYSSLKKKKKRVCAPDKKKKSDFSKLLFEFHQLQCNFVSYKDTRLHYLIQQYFLNDSQKKKKFRRKRRADFHMNSFFFFFKLSDFFVTFT